MKLFNEIFNVFTKASLIKSNKELKQKSVRFAITSIICSFLAVLLAFTYWVILKNVTEDLGAILQIILSVIIALCVVSTLIASLVRVIAQLSINRKIIGWIALSLFIATTLISAYFLISAIIV